MNEMMERLDGLSVKEDLFKDVKYFVTGQLDPKVYIYIYIRISGMFFFNFNLFDCFLDRETA